MKVGMPIQVLSSMNNGIGSDMNGTIIMNKQNLEGASVTGIASDKSQAQITIRGIENKPGELSKIFNALGEAGIGKDMITQPVAPIGTTDSRVDLTFTVQKNDSEQAVTILNGLGYEDIDTDLDIVKISIVGVGMASDHSVSATFFSALKDFNILAVATSEIKISVLVRAAHEIEALNSLHTAFSLDKK